MQFAAGKNKPLAGTQLWFLASDGLGFGNSPLEPNDCTETDAAQACSSLASPSTTKQQQLGISANNKVTNSASLQRAALSVGSEGCLIPPALCCQVRTHRSYQQECVSKLGFHYFISALKQSSCFILVSPFRSLYIGDSHSLFSIY